MKWSKLEKGFHLIPMKAALAGGFLTLAVFISSGAYFWNHYRYTPSEPLIADLSSELTFMLDAAYQPGEQAMVKISNTGSASYTALLDDERCGLEIYDSKDRIILQNYRKDAQGYTVVDIAPGQVTDLCILELAECTLRFPNECLKTQALGVGTYRILGKFGRRDGKETTIEQEVVISD